MEHVKVNLGNVLLVTGLAVVGVGAVGATAEYLGTKHNIPLVSPLARGIRQYLGWSLHTAGA